jgi:hypothetical protein
MSKSEVVEVAGTRYLKTTTKVLKQKLVISDRGVVSWNPVVVDAIGMKRLVYCKQKKSK